MKMTKVDVQELRVGMFVAGVVGSWADHGLWRTKFMISDAKVLEDIRHCGARSFWIDTEKSIAPKERLSADHGTAAAESAPVEPVAEHCGSNFSSAQAETTSFAEETVRAAKVLKAARDDVATLFSDARLGLSLKIDTVEPLVDDVVASIKRNSNALVSLLRLKSKDDYTFMHSVSVCALMVGLGQEMGLDEQMCRRLGLGGLLHDIGKARVPLQILNKPGKLSDEEFALVKKHSSRGHAMLLSAGVSDQVPLDTCRHHHEKFDGSGYPAQISGEQIPLAARMGAVCDVYDAITSPRPYKEAWDPAESLTKMASWRGHFDRGILAAFIRMLGVFPTGSLVRLSSGRLALVIENRRHALHTPVVKVFYSTKLQMNVPVQALDLASTGANEKIVSREPRENWSPTFLDSISSRKAA